MIVVLPESQEDQLFLGKKRKLGSLHCHFYNWGAWRRLSPGGVWNSRWQRRAEVGLPCPHPWPLTWGTQTGSSPSRSSASALPSPGLCLDPVWPFLVQSSISILESEASLALRSVRTGVLESVRVCLTPGGQLRLEGQLWSTTPNSQGLMVLFYALTPPPPHFLKFLSLLSHHRANTSWVQIPVPLIISHVSTRKLFNLSVVQLFLTWKVRFPKSFTLLRIRNRVC